MTSPLHASPLARSRAEFEDLVNDIRPELHRYCARMIGSVLESEDVVQEALAKAYDALPSLTAESNIRGWLFRIAHNKAIDYLRRAKYQQAEYLDDHPLIVEPDVPLEERELVAIALAVFLQLTPRQRSCVILKDVMRYSLADISEFLDATVPEIKAALHRGRTRLRELAKHDPLGTPVSLNERERQLLTQYVDRFNARDFDAVRAMLAEEVRLDLIRRTKLRGRADVSQYFHRYEQVDDWRLAVGTIEDRPAILVYAPDEESPPIYVMLIEWSGDQVSAICDYRYARHVMRDAQILDV